MRVVFAGTPEFSVPSLAVLAPNSDVDIVGVYTQPDRPAGRGRVLSPSPIKSFAQSRNLPVFQPQSLDDEYSRAQLQSLKPDLVLVVAYGIILPDWVLALPNKGCLNVHASLLPRWRGAAPIQRAIEAGDRVTGVSLMEIVPELDSGPVLSTLETEIGEDETGGSLHDKLSDLGARLILYHLPEIREGSLKSVPQDDTLATYARKLSRSESEIDWRLQAPVIERKIRAMNPWPAATTMYGNSVLKVLKSGLFDAPNAQKPGTVLKADRSGILVQTGDGILSLEQIQKPGGRPMSAREFLNGTAVEPGIVLGRSE